MSYKAEIESRLTDVDRWPIYVNPDYLDSLSRLANQALEKPDTKNCISAILIYQQLTEEMIKVLLRSCYFLIQVRMLPIEIIFKENKKLMFGQLIKELKATINFPLKNNLITAANIINKNRIEIAHGIVERGEVQNYSSLAQTVKYEYEMFFANCTSSIHWVREHLANHLNDFNENV